MATALILAGVVVGLTHGDGKVSDAVPADDSKATQGSSRPSSSPASPTPAPEPAPVETPGEDHDDVPVTMTARLVKGYEPGFLAVFGHRYIGVEVVVSNVRLHRVHANQLYFTATDSEGVRHRAEPVGTGAYGDFGYKELHRGEKGKGIVVFRGEFVPVEIQFSDGMVGPSYSAPVE